jgi:hypothetical protein
VPRPIRRVPKRGLPCRQAVPAVTVCAPASDQNTFAEADRRIDGHALPVGEKGTRFIVVATPGHGDEAALQAALAVEAAACATPQFPEMDRSSC